jgi:hypothetical protein
LVRTLPLFALSYFCASTLARQLFPFLSVSFYNSYVGISVLNILFDTIRN